MVVTIVVYGAAMSLYAPRVTPPPPLAVDLCARALADRPASCDTPGDAVLLFAGDTAEIDAASPTLARAGIDHPFEATGDLVRAADLAIANVEAPITDESSPWPPWRWLRDTPSYRAPAASAGALARAGFDVVGLANNHVLDHGPPALEATRANLAAAGVIPVGAGGDERAARRGVIVDLGHLRVGVLAYCERQIGFDLWLKIFALGELPGAAALDDHSLVDDVARLRAGGADLVVVLAHWGRNYQSPTGSQLAWAEQAARAGADLVVGAHPHTPQGIVLVEGKPVALSIGNYAFGTWGKGDLDGGVLLRAVVRRQHIVRLELLPIDVQNRRVDFAPRLLHGPAARAVLSSVATASRAFGTDVALRSDEDLAIVSVP